LGKKTGVAVQELGAIWEDLEATSKINVIQFKPTVCIGPCGFHRDHTTSKF